MKKSRLAPTLYISLRGGTESDGWQNAMVPMIGTDKGMPSRGI